MSEVNIPLLRKAVEWVEEQDRLPLACRQWNQAEWVTDGRNYELEDDLAYTLHVGTDAAYTWFHHLWGITTEEAQNLLTTGQICGTAYCVAGRIGSWENHQFENKNYIEVVDDGHYKEIHVSDYAIELLGISEEQGRDLFKADNDAADVRRIAEKIAGESL